jgi:ribonucleoside-diphosphate reductase alpha chain
MDNEILSGRSVTYGKNIEGILTELKDAAVDVNAVLADAIGIPRSAAITCIKPSGTVSQLVNSASGIHARHSQYYIRTVRGDNKDPLTMFLKDQGIPAEPDVMKPDNVTVFSFPIKSDGNCVTRNDMTALEQLDMWMLYAKHWCEHKPSVTISVRDSEWLAVGSWVWDNFDMCSGISFLPHSEHTYQQAPYQECDVTMYNEMLETMPPSINWASLQAYEQDDNTTGSQELSCAAGVCEVVDIAS